MSSSPIVDRIRIIPRPSDFLDRNVGSSGELFYNRESSSLRVYNGKDRSGYEIARADLDNVTDSVLETRINALGISGGSGGESGASVDIGENAPAEPTAGNLWLNTSNGKLYIYIDDGDSSQWIQPAAPTFSGNYNDLTNRPVFATVASSGSYNDLADKPIFTETGFDGSYNSLTNAPVISTVGSSGDYDDLINKPTSFSALTALGFTSGETISEFSSDATLADGSIATVPTEFAVKGYVDTSISNISSLSDVTLLGLTTLQQTTEKLNALTGASGVVEHDLANGSIFYHSSAAANFTANFTNVPTTDNRTISVVLILAQGVTPYVSTAIQIDGEAQTINWQGAVTPSGNANQIDTVSFTLIRTGAAWTVIGSLTTYGQ